MPGAAIGFKTAKGEKICAKVATSFISLDQAYQNLKELDGKDFEQTKDEAKAQWNKILGAIDVESDNVDDLRTFSILACTAQFSSRTKCTK